MRVRVRGQRTEIADRLVDRRVRFALGRLAGAIQEVSLLLAKSGEAACHERIRCSVRVRLAPGNEVSAVHADRDASTAVDGALERAARAVQRRLELEQHGFAHDAEGKPPW
jgi:ribosome-associated translation inhibitor RaiA